MAGPEKAYLLTEQGDKFECLFNPSELTITKSNTWQVPEKKGGNTPNLQFQAGGGANLLGLHRDHGAILESRLRELVIEIRNATGI